VCILSFQYLQGVGADNSTAQRRRRRSLLQASGSGGDQVTVYYDVGGVPSGQASSAAGQLASASTLQAFANQLRQAGAVFSPDCEPVSVPEGHLKAYKTTQESWLCSCSLYVLPRLSAAARSCINRALVLLDEKSHVLQI